MLRTVTIDLEEYTKLTEDHTHKEKELRDRELNVDQKICANMLCEVFHYVPYHHRTIVRWSKRGNDLRESIVKEMSLKEFKSIKKHLREVKR